MKKRGWIDSKVNPNNQEFYKKRNPKKKLKTESQKQKPKKFPSKLKIIIFTIITILIILFISRLTTPTEIDDIHPNWTCQEGYIEKSDILWVTPLYKNIPISENKTWCQEILIMNKTLGMHGIYHSFHEFQYNVKQEELQKGKNVFEECFGYQPTLFKPPYLKLSKENKKLLEKNNMTIKRIWNQNLHKVYHCENTGWLSNKFHDIF